MAMATLAAAALAGALAASLAGAAWAQGDGGMGEARALFARGEYPAAIAIYDSLLGESPRDPEILRLKGIAESNSGRHRESLVSFYTILQDNPNDAVALAGAGVGFGNLGEYAESRDYFARALEVDPESVVYGNYARFVDGVISKYPYRATEKPDFEAASQRPSRVPAWTTDVALWWASGKIGNDEFLGAISHLVSEGVIVVHGSGDAPRGERIPGEETLAEWVKGNVTVASLAQAVRDMISGGLVDGPQESAEEKAARDRDDLLLFKNYITRIISNVDKEKRYIEYPNPSGDVIKKFLRDYVKWNFDEEAARAATNFPDPEIDVRAVGATTIRYSMFINDQPSGLPLNHVETLGDSMDYWEAQTLEYAERDARIMFSVTRAKHEANVWVTWVVRDLGEGVLGHAHVGKGIVEVALGDYACDGSFQLYDVATVQKIMTHELGHSVGLLHSDNESSVMYPTLKPSYAYCLL
ncbi:MAG: M57 family metalloprotease [Thaumarchaeota archaeon]|nr:M57 family metalloprotease [Nitrososphaerota archaeon]MDD9843110.1 M57 family metalloprotease [Nitrososphaerota archaeon]